MTVSEFFSCCFQRKLKIKFYGPTNLSRCLTNFHAHFFLLALDQQNESGVKSAQTNKWQKDPPCFPSPVFRSTSLSSRWKCNNVVIWKITWIDFVFYLCQDSTCCCFLWPSKIIPNLNRKTKNKNSSIGKVLLLYLIVGNFWSYLKTDLLLKRYCKHCSNTWRRYIFRALTKLQQQTNYF